MRRLLASKLFSVIGPRGRNIANVASWSLVAKLTSSANLILAVPFVLTALGPSEFGAWATLVSLVAFAGFLDFGIGNSAMNLVATAHGRGDPDGIAAAIREGRHTLLLISLLLALLFAGLLPLLPWFRLLGLQDSLADSSRLAVASVFLAVVLGVPLNLATRVQLGLGRGDRAFRWQALGQLAALGLIVLLAKKQFSLPVLTAAAVLVPLIGPLANTISLLLERTDIRGGVRRPDIGKRIKQEGGLFFVLQLSAAFAFFVDLPLVAALSSADDAGTYAVVQRAFSIVPLGLSLVWAPLWPLYRQGLAAGHQDWVMRTLRRSTIAAACIAAVVGIAIAQGFDTLSTLWLGHAVKVPMIMLAGFAAWVVMEAVGNALATFLNAASVLRFQVGIAVAFAFCCVIGKVLAISNGHVSWLPWVTSVSWLLCALVPLIVYRRRIHDYVFAEGSGRRL